MNKFKFSNEHLNTIKLLKKSHEFGIFKSTLESHLRDIDKNMRASNDPNALLKLSGMAKQIEDILDSITSV